MQMRSLIRRFSAALTGVSMLATSLNAASALTIGDAAFEHSVASPQVQDVWYCRWNCGGWHPGWGYRPGWGWQAGWRGPGWQGPGWGVAVVGVPPVVHGGPCWRRWIGPNGGVHWTQVC